MRLWLSALFSTALLLPAQDGDYDADLREALQQLAKGKLGKAKGLLAEIVDAESEPKPADRPGPEVLRAARFALLRIEFREGNYEAVLEALAKAPAAGDPARPPAAALLLAQAGRRLGRYEQALAALQGVPGLEALWLTGMLQHEAGQRDAARKTWDQALQPTTAALSARDLYALARAKMALGGRARLEAASQDLVAAIQQAADDPEPKIAFAELKFLVYGEAAGFPSGDPDLRKVLDQHGDVEDALLALYRIRSANFQKDPSLSEEYLSRALAQNPRCVGALVARGAVLIVDRRFEEAAEVLDKALQINPRDRDALCHRAAAAYLLHDEAEHAAISKRLLAADPKCPELPRILGEHLVGLYRFADAIPCFEQALELDQEHVPALHGLAKALVYTGQGEKSVAVLDRAKKLQDGFVHAWRNNALAVEDLLRADYTRVEAGNFEFLMHKQDFEVLKNYLVPLHEEALRVLGDKYGFRPDGKVRVEVYHEWADFSVRTIGFRGFTALGACFGRFITIASPVDPDLRKLDFMWSATVWHEYAHVLTLGLSAHRVPRWLTEGASVHEERQKNPAWERGMDRELLDAWHNGEIYPLRLLNQAFRGPRILFGYYQGGLVVDYLAEKHGFAKVVEMLKAYATDLPAEEIFHNTFGYSTQDFDRRFKEHLWKTRLAQLRITPRYDPRALERLRTRISNHPDDHEARVALGFGLLQHGNPIDAGVQLAAVLKREPKHPGALLLQAELLRSKKELAAARAAYAAAFAAGAEDFDARLALAGILAADGDVDGAIAQLQLAKRCWPTCTDQASSPHLRISKLLRQAGRVDEAIMELKQFCRATARAFAPRLEVAAFEKAQNNRQSEARCLEECVQIDPFQRSVHVDLAEAYAALGKLDLAIREMQVALAVRPELDRENMGKSKDEIPLADAPQERAARARLCVRLAELCRAALRDAEVAGWWERAEKEAAGTEAEAEVAAARRGR